jgi:type I restriction-modification system DNA methylase subunit
MRPSIDLAQRMPRPVVEGRARFARASNLVRPDTFPHKHHSDQSSHRHSAAETRADYVLANPPFNDSDTALRACAFPQSEAKMQVESEARDKKRQHGKGATPTSKLAPA